MGRGRESEETSTVYPLPTPTPRSAAAIFGENAAAGAAPQSNEYPVSEVLDVMPQ
jgi:hypothetical protein